MMAGAVNDIGRIDAMECECLKVQPLGDGVWQCIMGDCRRKFIPADVCGKCPESQVEPQQPVADPSGAGVIAITDP